MKQSRTRVVLGVHDSLSGLRAVRRAVAEAQARGAVLHAVRAWTQRSTGCPVPVPAHQQDLDDAAASRVRDAFNAALGGLPVDIEVRIVTVQGPVGPVLVGYANREEDLLVVGVGRHCLIARVASPRIARYCIRHARSPVLVVPPHELAAVSIRSLARTLEREVRGLAGAGG
jgi:nucleotide-binding universal stress UspA family protein